VCGVWHMAYAASMDIYSQSASLHPWGDSESPYEELGGEDRLRDLTEAFYDVVEETAPELRAMLPEDTSGSRQKLFEFLSGWMGGPSLYWKKHGHPRLRMRHAPFAIDDHAVLEWSRCLDSALARIETPEQLRVYLATELGKAAVSLRNQA